MENNIFEGDEVSIYNDKGKVKGIARIEKENNEQVVIIEEGWGIESDSSINQLTSNAASDMGTGSILYDCTVAIKKL